MRTQCACKIAISGIVDHDLEKSANGANSANVIARSNCLENMIGGSDSMVSNYINRCVPDGAIIIFCC